MCRNIWFSLFFSSAAPRRVKITNRPENPVSLLENQPFEKYVSKIFLVWLKHPIKMPKIGPRWLGKIPRVDPRLTEGWPRVDPTSGVGSPRGASGGSHGLPPNVLFFREKKSARTFFSPDRGDCRYIWFPLFFLSRGSQEAPDHPRTRKSRFLIGKSTIL